MYLHSLFGPAMDQNLYSELQLRQLNFGLFESLGTFVKAFSDMEWDI